MVRKKKKYSTRRKTNLICMYLPAATAAGEANLAIDKASAEGGWRATALSAESVLFVQ
jgi:hypothetical protein